MNFRPATHIAGISHWRLLGIRSAIMPSSSEPAAGSHQRPQLVTVGKSEMADYGLTVHAVLPPPITGMTVCTAAVIAAVGLRVPVRRFNWSNGSPKITRRFRLDKTLRALTTPVRVLIGKRPKYGVFYMPCNAGFAVVFNFLALLAARLRGYRCVLHHHYYRYVDRYERRIKLLTRLLGPNDLQIVLCPEMRRGFHNQYGERLPIAVVPSTIQLLQNSSSRAVDSEQMTRRSGPFRLGHITNLQLAKGLDLVFEVLRALLSAGRDVRLILAGPIDTNVEQQMIESAQIEFGDRLDYRGPVYGDDKEEFFNDMDAMIYPTRNDAQPLVIMEAFSYGRPVVSSGRGCIPGMMPKLAWSILPCRDFVEPAVEQIEHWIEHPDEYSLDQTLARNTYDAAFGDARRALDEFVKWVCCEPTEGFVRCGTEYSSQN
jgi:glycosyltransferase involved in cell wall biosynthesis